MLYEIDSTRDRKLLRRRKNLQRDSVREILGSVSGIVSNGPSDGVVWRGQGSVDWRLESVASRRGLIGDKLIEVEEEMIRRARGIGANDAQRMGDWEILAKLRHHAAPNRLIDCTTDPFVALWFICNDAKSKENDGLLLAISRRKFKTIEHPYSVGNYRELNEKPEAILMYQTPPIDPRIAAQRGMFLLASKPIPRTKCTMSELGLLDAPTKSWVSKYEEGFKKLCGGVQVSDARGRPRTTFPDMIGLVIPFELKQDISNILEKNFGFSTDSMYPDFEGLGEYFSMP